MLSKLITAAVASMGMACAVAQELPREINFGVLSGESAQNLRQAWQPLLQDMEKSTGIKINAFFAPDYGGLVEGMRFNKVQLAWHGNKSAMEAVDRANAEIFARVVYTDGSIGYHAYMGVHRDSPLKSLEDVLKGAKGLTFGMGDPNSTSGFLVPSFYIFAQNRVDPRTAFKAMRSANHETNILAVANRQVDAAVFASDTWTRLEANRPEAAAQVRRIWTSPLIPSDPMLWRNDLHPEAKRRVKAFFLGYGEKDAREKEILKTLTYSRFIESSNGQLKPIRQLELFRDKTRIESDASLTAADRQARLADIERRLAELGR